MSFRVQYYDQSGTWRTPGTDYRTMGSARDAADDLLEKRKDRHVRIVEVITKVCLVYDSRGMEPRVPAEGA